MKRIVREFISAEIMHVGGSLNGTKSNGLVAEVDGNYIPADQCVTFEQAFAEWDSKPIAFVFIDQHINNNVAYIIDDYDPWDTDSRIFQYKFTDKAGIQTCSMKNIIEDDLITCYQADSWDDLHLNVFPTLIRMARE